MKKWILTTAAIAAAAYVARWRWNYHNPEDVAGRKPLTREEKEILADLENRLGA